MPTKLCATNTRTSVDNDKTKLFICYFDKVGVLADSCGPYGPDRVTVCVNGFLPKMRDDGGIIIVLPTHGQTQPPVSLDLIDPFMQPTD